jgi:hypothetical protein
VAAALATSLIFFAACSSAPRPLASRAIDAEPTVLIQYVYERGPHGELPPADCSLTLAPREAGKQASISLPSAEREMFAALEPGIYASGRLACASGLALKVDSFAPGGMRVQKDGIAYLGRLAIAVSGSGLTWRFSRRREAVASLRPVFAHFSSGASARMTSAFTGKRIAQEMVEAYPREPYHFSFRSAAGAPFDGRPMSSAVRNCVDAEQARNPLPIGSLSVHVAYVGEKVVSIVASGANSFSDEFEDCVKNSMQARAPGLGFPQEAFFAI